MTILRVTRREFVAALGGAAAWPLFATATEMRPRIVFLTLESQEDKGSLSAFTEALSGLGYVASQNIDIDYRYAAGDTKLLMPLAQELVALKPNVSIGGEPSLSTRPSIGWPNSRFKLSSYWRTGCS